MNKDRELTSWTVALIGKDAGADDKYRKVGGAEIIVKDGIVQEIRGV